jgi:hypothetical protein
MRRFFVLPILAALALPVAAYADAQGPGDGTLAVRNGDGGVTLNARGALIGLVSRGRVEVESPKDADCDALSVWGAEREKVQLKANELVGPVTVCVFGGKDVRFRLVGGPYHVRLFGQDISLSAVGKGVVTIKGQGGPDGAYSVNGGEFASLPDEAKRFVLSSPTPPQPVLAP